MDEKSNVIRLAERSPRAEHITPKEMIESLPRDFDLGRYRGAFVLLVPEDACGPYEYAIAGMDWVTLSWWLDRVKKNVQSGGLEE